MQLTLVVKLCSAALIIALTASADAFDLTQPPREEWPTYGGGFDNQRFSQLAQITRDNVQHLRVKWTFPIPDAGQSTTSLETTPLVIKGSEAGQPAHDAVMFVTSPLNRVLALDAATGERLWEAAAPCDIRSGFVARAVTGASPSGG